MMKHSFYLYWLTGTKDSIVAATLPEACNALGYSQGALGALDFFSEGEDSHIFDGVEKKWKERKDRFTDGSNQIFDMEYLLEGKSAKAFSHWSIFNHNQKDKLNIVSFHNSEGWIGYCGISITHANKTSTLIFYQRHLVEMLDSLLSFGPKGDDILHFNIGGSEDFGKLSVSATKFPRGGVQLVFNRTASVNSVKGEDYCFFANDFDAFREKLNAIKEDVINFEGAPTKQIENHTSNLDMQVVLPLLGKLTCELVPVLAESDNAPTSFNYLKNFEWPGEKPNDDLIIMTFSPTNLMMSINGAVFSEFSPSLSHHLWDALEQFHATLRGLKLDAEVWIKASYTFSFFSIGGSKLQLALAVRSYYDVEQNAIVRQGISFQD